MPVIRKAPRIKPAHSILVGLSCLRHRPEVLVGLDESVRCAVNERRILTSGWVVMGVHLPVGLNEAS